MSKSIDNLKQSVTQAATKIYAARNSLVKFKNA